MKMKKITLSLILCTCSIIVFAQKQAANWYFGENAGLVFDLETNTIAIASDGQLTTREGCASISDENGNLLFYTDGIGVWNKSHNLMMNGQGLFGDSSSTQSAIIVPKPKNPFIYYIFTVDTSLDGMNTGFNYSEVDMRMDGGLGSVTQKNTNLLRSCSEKITAVLKDCLTETIWVIAYATPDGNPGIYDTYHAYEVSELGVSPTSVKSSFFRSNPVDPRGYLKLSPDGTKVASANVRSGLFIYDFDAATGKLSNEIPLIINATNSASFPYGVEFSPNNQLLYVNSSNDFSDRFNLSNENDPMNHFATLTQFDLTNADIQSTEVVLDSRNLFRGGLQLGPNGKIYRALSKTYLLGASHLGVIENPDRVGTASQYRHNAINLSPFTSSQGLPPFITSFFNTEIDIIKNGQSRISLDLCEGEGYTLVSEDIPGATYSWSLDGAVLPNTGFDLLVTQGGRYEVFIDLNNGECALVGQAFVTYSPYPVVNNHTLIQCDEDGTPDGITLFNLNEASDALTGATTGMSTKFYLDAARTIEITNPENFINTSAMQTIYVEVINDRTLCKTDGELVLGVSTTNSLDAELFACDDDDTEDGLYLFRLSDANNSVVSGLPDGLSISYYETYENALTEQNRLGPTFRNNIPYSQVVYARVENDNDCYGISEITLTVHELPDVESENLVHYCTNFFPQTITIDAGLNVVDSSDYTYDWSNGNQTFQTEINTIGSYTVNVTNKITGCTKQHTITVEPSNLAIIESIEVTDATQNNKVVVNVSGEGIYQYSLIREDNAIEFPYQDSTIFENVAPGIYTLLIKDIENDCGVVKDAVSVIGFPKFFTPNNDGRNDTWQVYGVSRMFQPNTKVLIFNRYGRLITELTPLGNGWDGTLNGIALPSDDYWFSVTLQDGRVFKNHFTLKL